MFLVALDIESRCELLIGFVLQLVCECNLMRHFVLAVFFHVAFAFVDLPSLSIKAYSILRAVHATWTGVEGKEMFG
jgi:hypothetical protein